MSTETVMSGETVEVSKEEVADGAEASAGEGRSASVWQFIGRGRKAGERTVKMKTVVSVALILAMMVAVGVFGWQLHAKSNELGRLHRQAADDARAEQVGLDYAAGAADMDFHDLAPWRGRLTKGTSPELANRLSQAASSMEQIIEPLQWTSAAKPITAKVRSESNGMYTVDCFVSVLTKNSQAPSGIQSTATYGLTIDAHKNWVITDIAGMDSVLASKNAPR